MRNHEREGELARLMDYLCKSLYALDALMLQCVTKDDLREHITTYAAVQRAAAFAAREHVKVARARSAGGAA